MVRFSQMSLPLVVFTALTVQAGAPAQTVPEYTKALNWIPKLDGWNLKADGTTQTDPNRWKAKRQEDGSEIFVFVPPAKATVTESRRAIVRENGQVKSVSDYQLKPVNGQTREFSTSAVFENGKFSALTRCEETEKIGRSCLTITPSVCNYIEDLRSAKPLEETASRSADSSLRQPSTAGSKVSTLNEALERKFLTFRQELEKTEVRAIATILALRGVSHQLENVSKFGNRLGMKFPEQTTTGKISGATVDPTTVQQAAEFCKAKPF